MGPEGVRQDVPQIWCLDAQVSTNLVTWVNVCDSSNRTNEFKNNNNQEKGLVKKCYHHKYNNFYINLYQQSNIQIHCIKLTSTNLTIYKVSKKKFGKP